MGSKIGAEYFDCNVLEQLEGQENEYVPQPEEINPTEELNLAQSLDLFDYISNMNVAGEQQKKVDPNEENKEYPKDNDPFNFDNFAV